VAGRAGRLEAWPVSGTGIKGGGGASGSGAAAGSSVRGGAAVEVRGGGVFPAGAESENGQDGGGKSGEAEPRERVARHGVKPGLPET
jgi:hypothetical protein